MSQKFTQAFKIQAVEKALNRAEGISVLEIAESLSVGYSTLQIYGNGMTGCRTAH